MELTDEQQHRATLAALMELKAQEEDETQDWPYVEVEPARDLVTVDGTVNLKRLIAAIAVAL